MDAYDTHSILLSSLRVCLSDLLNKAFVVIKKDIIHKLRGASSLRREEICRAIDMLNDTCMLRCVPFACSLE